MTKARTQISKLSKTKKITYVVLLMCFVFMLGIVIPTLSRLLNSSGSSGYEVWDGTVADDFNSGSGTSTSPYVITNGSELAYLSQQLQYNNYENTHFILEDNIILNDGRFDYDIANGIMYILDDTTYYVSPYNSNYYATADRIGSPVGTINIFPTLANFKGNLMENHIPYMVCM